MSDTDRPGSATRDSVDLIFQVSNGHEVQVVADQLRQAGVLVERALARTRVIGGKAPRSLMRALGKIPGVKMVREADMFQLPPFDSDVPQ